MYVYMHGTCVIDIFCVFQVQSDKRIQEATLLPLGEYQDLEEAGVCARVWIVVLEMMLSIFELEIKSTDVLMLCYNGSTMYIPTSIVSVW